MNKNKQKKDGVAPKTYYEELAELGILEEALKSRFEFNYRNDRVFRENMREILYKFSPNPVALIEELNLKFLIEGVSHFLEYTKEYIVNMDFMEILSDEEIKEMRAKLALDRNKK